MHQSSDLDRKPRHVFIMVSLLTLIALFFGTYTYYVSETDRIREEQYHQLSSVAQTRADLIHNWRMERLGDAEVISSAPLISERLVNLAEGRTDSSIKASILESLKAILKAYGYSEILILGPESHILISTRPDPEAITTVEEDAVKESLAKRNVTLSELYRDTRGRVMIDSVAPFLDHRGQTMGVVVLRVDAEKSLFPIFESWPTPSKTAESLIARRDGDQVVGLNEFRHKRDTALSFQRSIAETHFPAVQAALGKVGMFLGKDYRGMDVLADLRKIPESNWFMVTKVDMGEILTEARSWTMLVAIVCLMAVAISGVVTAYLSRRRQLRLYLDLYQSERLQRESHEEFRTTLYSIGDAVITTDRDGLVKQMNPVAELLTGWLESEAEGKRLEEVFHIVNEYSSKRVDTPVEKVLQTGKLVGLANHTMLISRDGSKRPIADSASPITEKDGSIVGVVLVFRDQSKERTDQRALEESEERQRRLFEHLPQRIFVKDRNSVYVSCNHKYASDLGISPEEIVGRNDLEFFPEDLARSYQNDDQACMSSGTVKDVTEAYMVDRQQRWIHTIKVPYLDQTGEVVGVLGIFEDITDAKRAEDNLIESEQRFRTVFENDFVVMLVIDPQTGAIEDASPAACSFYGYRLETLKQKTIFEINMADPELVSWSMRQASAKQIQYFDFQHRLANGESRDVKVCSGPIMILGRQFLFSIVTDETERKRVEQDREKSLERQNRLNQLYQALLTPGALLPKLKMITDSVVDIFEADFCRIWRVTPGDLCEHGCMHSEVTEGPHVCSDRSRCLRLEASSGRYTHTDGVKHRRVPFGAYKIGLVASGEEHKFLTNDAANDRRIHDREWARELGLVSFAGYQLSPPDGERLGVLALFSKHPISPEEDAQLDALSATVARLIHSATVEETLHESEERFRTAFMTSPDAITLSHLSGTDKGVYLDVNEGFSDLTGYTREESIGKSAFDLGIWFDPEARERLVAGLKDSGKVTNFETSFRCKNGQIKSALLSARLINLHGSRYILAITRDVDDLKETEDALRTSEERFRQAAEFVGDWIWELDKNGLFTYCSSAVFQAIGYTPEELVGKLRFWEIVTPQLPGAYYKANFFSRDL